MGVTNSTGFSGKSRNHSSDAAATSDINSNNIPAVLAMSKVSKPFINSHSSFLPPPPGSSQN
jgi:hypothetical protein